MGPPAGNVMLVVLLVGLATEVETFGGGTVGMLAIEVELSAGWVGDVAAEELVVAGVAAEELDVGSTEAT